MSESHNTSIFHHSSMDDMLRQWWMERFDTPLPEDVRSEIRTLLRQELQHERLVENLLDDNTLQQIHEGRRLCQTKLTHLDSSIIDIKRKLEYLHQFLSINAELNKQSNELYRLNKEKAAIQTEWNELERFEAFEPASQQVQRIHLLSSNIESLRQDSARKAAEIDSAQKNADASEQKVIFEKDIAEDATHDLISAALKMADGERLTTQIEGGRQFVSEIEKSLSHFREQSAMLKKELVENETAYDQLQQEMKNLRVQQQALEVHSQMLQNCDATKMMLDELINVDIQRKTLTQELNQALRRQEESNEQLGRLFSESQNLESQIRSKQDEVDGHRRNIMGQDSYDLQRRALELRSRLLMLKTSSSLWQNIATGFDLIEKKEAEITRLRLHADHLNHNLDVLENEERQLLQLVEHKNYHLTVLKSQNVIELRGDLEEGSPCSVCGATHHPWKGDSILEQNALITSLKSDCNAATREYNNKRHQLLEVRKDLIETLTRLETETDNLATLWERQRKDTEEWKNFSFLDRSFTDCSPSTNRDARRTLLQLLIEKTTVDAENAEKELETFTFHLDSISSIGVSIQKLQQHKADIAVRLNEENTACQVMAGLVENIKQRLQQTTNAFQQRYERLEEIITLPEWFSQWKETPENLKMLIQQMHDKRDIYNEQLHQMTIKATHLKTEKDLLQRAYQQTITDISTQENFIVSVNGIIEKAENSLSKIIPEGSGKDIFEKARKKYEEQQEKVALTEQAHTELTKVLQDKVAHRNAIEEFTHCLEQDIAQERRELDIWMNRYNANHPPVQIKELETVLAGNKEWADIRKRVRQVQMELATVQSRVDHLRAQVVALQANGLRPISDDGDMERNTLKENLSNLEQQQRELLQQLARYDIRLQAHNQAISMSINKS